MSFASIANKNTWGLRNINLNRINVKLNIELPV